jgi:hypothetical protein
VPEAEEYVAAVIDECVYRYNIDTNRVVLGGISMGAYGAYDLCQRLADRIAGGLLWAGKWHACDWRAMVGTPAFIVHGARDAVPNADGESNPRPRWTDVFYAREAHRLLTAAGVEHEYCEHGGGHFPYDAVDCLSRFVQWMATQRRDPYYPRVVAVTPRGWDAGVAQPVPHHRWVSIGEIGDGEVTVDSIVETGPARVWGDSAEQFRAQGFQRERIGVRGGVLDARYVGDNEFEVATENVRRLALWLHPRMVDFARPVGVTTDGARRLHMVMPSLLDTVRSCERRRDWGLIYHAELQLCVST